eukprot:7024796-Lingulodinium_polyedra.AAC.1
MATARVRNGVGNGQLAVTMSPALAMSMAMAMAMSITLAMFITVSRHQSVVRVSAELIVYVCACL